MPTTDAAVSPEVRQAAEAALRSLFHGPHELQFRSEQVTLDAANFAFQALVKVDRASRASASLFKLWSPVPARSWSAFPIAFAKAVLAATKNPGAYSQSPLGLTTVITRRRELQHHLNDPEMFDCPEFR